MTEKKPTRRRLSTLTRALRGPFFRHDDPEADEQDRNRRINSEQMRKGLGALLDLDAPLEFRDKDRNRFDVASTNDNGALLVGPGNNLQPGDQIRLGRRMNAGLVFVMVTVLSVDSIGRRDARLAQIRVGWDVFTGTSEELVRAFFQQKLRVDVASRFRAGAVTTP